ncbi:hypothetical protein OG943_09455 [Amycolatopsis sp. NBC_00345]|uniref:hypothetical protein n=1 Tax=Amycolatopsis sp. NBC_00345 TaxID=2975955 RepID=UPI002E2770F2
MDGARPDSDGLLRDYLAEVTDGVPGTATVDPPHRLPWLAAVKAGALSQADESGMFKAKAAYLRRRFTDEQIGTAYTHLTSADHKHGVQRDGEAALAGEAGRQWQSCPARRLSTPCGASGARQEAAAAHDISATGHARGKIVITVRTIRPAAGRPLPGP